MANSCRRPGQRSGWVDVAGEFKGLYGLPLNRGHSWRPGRARMRQRRISGPGNISDHRRRTRRGNGTQPSRDARPHGRSLFFSSFFTGAAVIPERTQAQETEAAEVADVMAPTGEACEGLVKFIVLTPFLEFASDIVFDEISDLAKKIDATAKRLPSASGTKGDQNILVLFRQLRGLAIRLGKLAGAKK